MWCHVSLSESKSWQQRCEWAGDITRKQRIKTKIKQWLSEWVGVSKLFDWYNTFLDFLNHSLEVNSQTDINQYVQYGKSPNIQRNWKELGNILLSYWKLNKNCVDQSFCVLISEPQNKYSCKCVQYQWINRFVKILSCWCSLIMLLWTIKGQRNLFWILQFWFIQFIVVDLRP